MDYLEMMDIQERIIDYEKRLKDRISYIDDQGNRKLDPYYFLSAEVAAYKLLRLWKKKLDDDLDVLDDHVSDLLDLIKQLVDESYESYEIYEAEISMPLWYELAKENADNAISSFNAEIIVMASYIETIKGVDPSETLIVSMNEEELVDPNSVSYAYSIVHDYLISLSKEKLEEFAEAGFGLNANRGELYKLHFNLFT